jgi:small subunit ribosomal protein S6
MRSVGSPGVGPGSGGGEPLVRPYEAVIIFEADLEDGVVDALIERSLDLLRSHDAVPGTVDRWGKRQLAYEVRHKREGYYVVVAFSSEPKAVFELDRSLHLLDEVLRHKIVRLPDRVAKRAPAGVTGNAPGRAGTAAAG